MGWLRNLLAFILGHRTPDPLPSPSPSPSPSPDTISTLLELHNKERAHSNLPPLVLNPLLNTMALTWAAWMAIHRTMSHNAGGFTFSGRIANSGYSYSAAGENIAEGQLNPNAVMDAWMNSAGHRANILGDFTDVGFAVFPDSNGNLYWCTDFGTPLGHAEFGATSVSPISLSGPLFGSRRV